MTRKCEVCGREAHPRLGCPGRCGRCEDLQMDLLADIAAETEGLI